MTTSPGGEMIHAGEVAMRQALPLVQSWFAPKPAVRTKQLLPAAVALATEPKPRSLQPARISQPSRGNYRSFGDHRFFLYPFPCIRYVPLDGVQLPHAQAQREFPIQLCMCQIDSPLRLSCSIRD